MSGNAVPNIIAITKRELTGFFTSAIAYVFIVFSLLLLGFFTFQVADWFAAGQANLYWFFFWHPVLYVILAPAVGMGIWHGGAPPSGPSSLCC